MRSRSRRRSGLSAEQVASTATGVDAADDPAGQSGDALLVRLADELHDTATVSDELWAQLAGRYTDQQLLELIVTAGWYRTIAYVIERRARPARVLGGSLPGRARGCAICVAIVQDRARRAREPAAARLMIRRP